MVIAHISDVHFGRIADSRVVGALVDDVRAADPVITVVGGDLTQRARPREWKEARALLDALPGELVVIAGNHDVYPWWFPFRRIFTPLGRYRRAVERPPDVAVERPSLRLIGLNSAYGLTGYGGRFTAAQADVAEAFLRKGEPTDYRILVIHHQAVHSEYTRRPDVAKRTNRVLAAAVRARVDLILDGHVHRSEVGLLESGGRSVIRCSAGTATSDRGRFRDRGRNLYSLIRLGDEVEVEERAFDRERGIFRHERQSAFLRVSGGWAAATTSVPDP